MPTPTQLLSVLSERGTCSAEDLCRHLGCSVGDVLKMIHWPLWWDVESFAGPRGWLYRLRIVEDGYVPRVMEASHD